MRTDAAGLEPASFTIRFPIELRLLVLTKFSMSLLSIFILFFSSIFAVSATRENKFYKFLKHFSTFAASRANKSRQCNILLSAYFYYLESL